MTSRTVLVTNASGPLGLDVMRLARTRPEVRIVAVCTQNGSAASLFADAVEHVGWNYEREQLDVSELGEIAAKHNVDLILPTTDVDAVLLRAAADAGQLPPVAGSPAQAAEVCFDKWETARAATRGGAPYARSWLPDDVSPVPTSSPVVVKPRRGGLSAGVVPTIARDVLAPEGSLVQDHLKGVEVTATMYVTRRGRFVGWIGFERELRFGITWTGRTADRQAATVAPVVRAWADLLGVQGSCNIQGKVTADGFIPFEINCRVSGSARARAAFGFEDVHWLVEEWLFDDEPTPPSLRSGAFARSVETWVLSGATGPTQIR